MAAASLQSTPSSRLTASRASSAAGRGPGVESRQVFAVGNEALEYLSGQVVVIVHAATGNVKHLKADDIEYLRRFLRGQFNHYVAGNLKNVQIVDVQNAVPGGQDFGLRVGGIGVADLRQGLDAVAPGQSFVKEHGVGDNGAGHAAHLGDIVDVEAPGNCRADVGAGFRHLVKNTGGRVDTLLQVVGRGIHRLLRHRHQPDQVGQIGHAAGQPPRLGKAAAVFIPDAVMEPGAGQGGGGIRGRGDSFGIPQGDGGFHGSDFGVDGDAQARLGVRFRVGAGVVFRLNDHRRASGCGDQHIRVPPRVAGNGLRQLGTHHAAGQHRAQQVGQRHVGSTFDLAGSHSGLSRHLWGSRDCITSQPAGGETPAAAC